MRNKGIGKALYTQVMQYAQDKGVKRVEWVVLDWNTNAVNFYESTGATLLKDWYLVQMTEQGLGAFIQKQKGGIMKIFKFGGASVKRCRRS